MDRRAFLATLTAGVAGTAGCAALGGRDGTRESTVTPVDRGQTADGGGENGTPGGDATFERPADRTSVVEHATNSHTVALRPTTYQTDDRTEVALWFDRPATADEPALLRGWIRNVNDFANTARVGWLPVVGRRQARAPRGGTYEVGLVAVPTADNPLANRSGAVARDSNGNWYARDAGSVPETYRFGPGEGVQLSYLLASAKPDAARPTGSHEFRGRDTTVTVTAWETASPGPDGDSRFAGRSVPPLNDGVGWYHEADGSTQAFVRPGTERVDLDAALTFEAVNHGRESLTCGHWNLYKLVDGEWFHVGPFGHLSDCRVLAPGERKRWTLRAFNGDPVGCGTDGSCDGFTRGRLGGGRYGVVAGYGVSPDESGALVELRGESVTVTPTADAEVERDGGKVTVTTATHGDGERPPDGRFVLTRATEADERVIPEQVMGGGRFGGLDRRSGLRNALAAVGAGVGQVVVRTDERAVDGALGADADERRLRFGGTAYLLRREPSG